MLRNREHDGVHGGATYSSAGPWHTQVLQGSRAPTTGTVARQMKRQTAQPSRAFRATVRILQARGFCSHGGITQCRAAYAVGCRTREGFNARGNWVEERGRTGSAIGPQTRGGEMGWRGGG